jgi:hypothetical protein
MVSRVVPAATDPWFTTLKLIGNPFVRDTVDGIESDVTIRSGREVEVAELNVAVTPMAPLTVTAHVPVPPHPPPLQPANVEPDAALAVSVTRVPAV